MLSKIKPPLVLTLICTVISAALIFVYNATYVDTTGIITDSLKKGLTEIYGEAEYTMLKNEDGTVLTYDGITSVIVNDKKQVSFEVIADGYAKKGIHVLVGVSDNGVEGISFIELGETPGLGTKVRDDSDFVKQFLGVKNDEYEFSAVTGATFSSKGMKNAVNTALEAYENHREELINE